MTDSHTLANFIRDDVCLQDEVAEYFLREVTQPG